MPEHPALVFDVPQPAVAAARTAEELMLLICALKNCRCIFALLPGQLLLHESRALQGSEALSKAPVVTVCALRSDVASRITAAPC